MTSYEEWRVTGDPGDGFPAYSVGGWPDGPYLHRRTVTVTEWEEA